MIVVWIGFIALVLGMLLVDLGVFHRRPHATTVREGMLWTIVWIGAALIFNVAVYYAYENRWWGLGVRAGESIGGRQAALEFLTVFVLEKSLSLDNLFVMAVIFAYFGIPRQHQHRVLFWGILGVLVLRGVMIVAGVALLNLFTWLSYVFGALLIISAIKLLRAGNEPPNLEANPLLRLARRLYPVSSGLEGGRFLTRVNGQPAITPLLLVLLVIESTDVVFALDSVPAALGVSRDPFVVYTSNVFAVLGLRSLYFVLAGILHKFQHLRTSLVVVLLYIGVKMLLVDFYHIDVGISLIVILGILAVGAVASSGESAREDTAQASVARHASGVSTRSVEALPSGQGESLGPSVADRDDLAVRAVRVSKFYGRYRGISDLSLDVRRGELIGLLGPNGAGKTTLIRILCCHMPPTSGIVQVCGFDVFSQPLEVRSRLGYLPENCPLYPELRVMEYLQWTAQMKGMSGSEVDKSVFRTLDECNIDHVRSQVIGTLSKGYRQRVGLAAALIHRPQLLILDEPTIGLDPLQAREFRSLIGSLKGKHTILISSHILSEIDAICDSVAIINDGSVVASGSPTELRRHVAPRYSIECRNDPALKVLIPKFIRGIEGITLEDYEDQDNFVRFRLIGNGADPRLELFRVFAGAGIELREMSQERVTLEDVFLRYTRKEPAAETTSKRKEAVA